MVSVDGCRYVALPVRSPEPQAGGRWGERIAVAGDLTGDGTADLFVGVPAHTVAGHLGAGRVYALSGAALAEGTAEVLWTVDAPRPQRGMGFGFAIAPCPALTSRVVTLPLAVGTASTSGSSTAPSER